MNRSGAIVVKTLSEFSEIQRNPCFSLINPLCQTIICAYCQHENSFTAHNRQCFCVKCSAPLSKGFLLVGFLIGLGKITEGKLTQPIVGEVFVDPESTEIK